jgi:hypothetical protein
MEDAPRPVRKEPAAHAAQAAAALIPAPLEYRPAPQLTHADAALAPPVIE